MYNLSIAGIERRREAVARHAGVLEALSPLRVLSRGYSVTLHGGEALLSAGGVRPGDCLTTILANGRVESTVARAAMEPPNL